MKIKIINLTKLPIPHYKSEGAAGIDLMAAIDEPMVLEPLGRALITTGLKMEIPLGYEGQIRPRSGLAINYGISLVNCVGTIDSDYRGEIKVPVINLSKEEYIINPGDRIAQMIFAKYERAEFQEVEELSETQRGENGFGSTGYKEI